LGNQILQLANWPPAVHHNRTATAEVLERLRIADVDSYRGHGDTKVCRNGFRIGEVAAPDKNLLVSRAP